MKRKKLKKKLEKKLEKKIDKMVNGIVDDIIDEVIDGLVKEFEESPASEFGSKTVNAAVLGPEKLREKMRNGSFAYQADTSNKEPDSDADAHSQVEELKKAFSKAKENIGNKISSVAESEKVTELKDTFSKCADSAANASADVLETIANKIRK